METRYAAERVKNYLIKLGMDDKMPLDLNELNLDAIEYAIKGEDYENKQMIDAADNILSDGDIEIFEMIQRIAEHENKNDYIDNVDGVLVWQPLMYQYTCDKFLNEIGYKE